MLRRIEQTPSGLRYETTLDSQLPKQRGDAATSAVDQAALHPPRSEPSSEATEEFRALLQRRIGVMWAFGAAVVGTVFLLAVFFPDKPFIEPPPRAHSLFLLGLTTMSLVVGAVLALGRRAAPMPWLRAVETSTLICI